MHCAVGGVPGADEWRQFIDKMLLLLATTLLLTGVIFFFAYNWAEMHRFIKFALLQVTLLSMALFASLRGLERLSGQAALLAAAVLLGALLAVYGQTYQTGADAFGLFLTWAILIIPWVLLSTFASMWLLLLVLLNLSLVLYWGQVIEVQHYQPYTALFLLVFLLILNLSLIIFKPCLHILMTSFNLPSLYVSIIFQCQNFILFGSISNNLLAILLASLW